MKVVLIRHGMTAANEQRLYCGKTDLPLSYGGICALLALAKSMPSLDGAYFASSPMKRARQTLFYLFGEQPCQIIEGLREIDFGDFEMKSYQELKGRKDYQDWLVQNETARCPGGESKPVFLQRVLSGWAELAALAEKQQARRVVLVTHGGVISALMEHFFPGQKNFYEWQPSFGRGYQITLGNQVAYRDF